jgi:hypothetical protein
MGENLSVLFNAIKDDWALVDESDADEYYVLVNADRDEYPDLRPSKSSIEKLEQDGFISFEPTKSDSKNKVREYSEFLGEVNPIPLVYFYKLTDKGAEYT